jgi:hypothetical protein
MNEKITEFQENYVDFSEVSGCESIRKNVSQIWKKFQGN